MNQLIASVASEAIAMHGDNDYKSNWLCINYYAVFSMEFIMEQSVCMTPLKVKIGLLNDIVQLAASFACCCYSHQSSVHPLNL